MRQGLVFEKYTVKDFAIYYSLVKDDDVMKYITGKGMSENEAQQKFDSILSINEQEDALGYFKLLDQKGFLIGDCKLVNYEKDPAVFEIGYLLKKAYWNRGLGTQVCENLLALATKLDFYKDIVGIIDPDNIASKRLLEKFGFKSYFIGIEDQLPTQKLRLLRTSKK
ncbi:GNAT family N-acetyltransferase [Sphingobacterium sp. LRF_L2]|uniref:GNAT family N-acetyltransferase n=1 Tax=Sphingobacterium sp. LRF_L2 TaxID=3369421 RepID=UPI003F6088F4